jgi:prepilin-type N-terminal cleavage/methylation domain-containing protein
LIKTPSEFPTTFAIFDTGQSWITSSLTDSHFISGLKSMPNITNSNNPSHTAGFSLIELLIVVAIIGVLVALALPGLSMARRQARITTCAINLRQCHTALSAHAADNKNQVPRGPDIPIVFTPAVQWSQLAHRLIWIPYFGGAAGVPSPGEPNGLGVLLKNQYLSETKALFCPGDELNSAQENINLYNQKDTSTPAYGSYIYRQLAQTSPKATFDSLGFNQTGGKARAIAFDQVSEGFTGLTADNHGSRACNVVFDDGHVSNLTNCSDAMVFRAQDSTDLTSQVAMFTDLNKRVNQVLVNADYSLVGDPAQAPQLP